MSKQRAKSARWKNATLRGLHWRCSTGLASEPRHHVASPTFSRAAGQRGQRHERYLWRRLGRHSILMDLEEAFPERARDDKLLIGFCQMVAAQQAYLRVIHPRKHVARLTLAQILAHAA